MKRVKDADVLNKNIMELIIPEDNVALVFTTHPLEHALLVLVKSGYSAIPVLDKFNKFKGIISKTVILNKIFGLERIEFEKLSEYRVDEAMKTDIPIVKPNDSFLTVMKLAIDQPFLCVVDEDGYFKGLLPRSALLKFLNHFLRDLSHESVVPH